MNLLPDNGEVAMLPESAVAKHFLSDARELNVQTQSAVEPQSDGLQHFAEELLLVGFVGIDSFLVRVRVCIYKRRKPKCLLILERLNAHIVALKIQKKK